MIECMSNPTEQSRNLAQAGMPPAQAEAVAKAIHDAVAPSPLRLEVLEERVKHTATTAELSATTAQINKLHGEAMTRMNELHLEAMKHTAKVEGDLTFIKWLGIAFAVAGIAGFVRYIAG